MEGVRIRMTEHDTQVLRGRLSLGRTFFFLLTGVGGIACILACFFSSVMVGLFLWAAFALLGWLICRLFNCRINADLALAEKVVVVKTIDNFVVNPKQQSSARNDRLTPRASRFIVGWTLITGNLSYWVGSHTYQLLKDQTRCEFHYAPLSNELLCIVPVGYNNNDEYDPEEPFLLDL